MPVIIIIPEMGGTFEFNKTLLFKIILRIMSKTFEIKLDAELRVNVRNAKTFQSFLSHFRERTGKSYSKTSQTDTVGKKTLLSGVRKGFEEKKGTKLVRVSKVDRLRIKSETAT